MWIWTGNGLILAAIGVLIGSLIAIRKLLVQLPPGEIRTSWRVMAALVLMFIGGYITYGGRLWRGSPEVDDLIVPWIFLLGACFVAFSSRVALRTVTNVQRVNRLERENITDPLSGIYNRRYLERRLKQEMEKASQYRMPLSVLLIDVDRFKQINDTLGHQVGDHVLSHLGRLIVATCRGGDIAARYGGDELLIMAPNTSLEQAHILAERLRCAIASHPLEVADTQGQPTRVELTVCIGVASCEEESQWCENLIEAADAALYRAKAAGRNGVATQ